MGTIPAQQIMKFCINTDRQMESIRFCPFRYFQKAKICFSKFSNGIAFRYQRYIFYKIKPPFGCFPVAPAAFINHKLAGKQIVLLPFILPKQSGNRLPVCGYQVPACYGGCIAWNCGFNINAPPNILHILIYNSFVKYNQWRRGVAATCTCYR